MNKDYLTIITGFLTAIIPALLGTVNLFVQRGNIVVSIVFYIIVILIFVITAIIILNRKKKDNCKIEKSLIEHSFFSDLQLYIKININKIEIKDSLKKKVITSFLKIQFQVFHNSLKDYVLQSEKTLKKGGHIIIEDIQRIFFDCITKYNEQSRSAVIKHKGNVIPGVPECFLESFDRWHTPHVNMICEGMRDIINNELYPNETMKLLAIIELFAIVFKLTIDDALQAKDELNGELEEELNKIISKKNI